jgi:hypothetical protein
MQFILQENSNANNTAISSCCHWRDGSSYIRARVFSASSMSYTDYNSNANWDNSYGSSVFWGVALSTGNALVYHNPQVWLYSSYNSRTQVTAAPPPMISDVQFGGACIIPDGTDSWLSINGTSSQAPFLSKWTINPSTYVWTQNWESEAPLTLGTSSYLKLSKLPNGRFMLMERQSAGIAKYWIFNRSSFPA